MTMKTSGTFHCEDCEVAVGVYRAIDRADRRTEFDTVSVQNIELCALAQKIAARARPNR